MVKVNDLTVDHSWHVIILRRVSTRSHHLCSMTYQAGYMPVFFKVRGKCGGWLGKSLNITVYFLSLKYPFHGQLIKHVRAYIPTSIRIDHRYTHMWDVLPQSVGDGENIAAESR